MILENTKLLFRLYYRPISAMSSIIDEGHWLYAAVVVAALSLLLQTAVISHIYYGYEAVYRESNEQPVERVENTAPDLPNLATAKGVSEENGDSEEYVPVMPTVERLPLPVVGLYGWWFVSFAPGSFISTVLGIALLYVPLLVLLSAMSAPLGSFSVVLRRDYGPLVTCAVMAWAASHLPFALLGLGLSRMAFAGPTALVLWTLSALAFGLMMALGIRTLFGIGFKRALLVACVGAFAFSIQAKLFSAVSPYLFSPFILFYAYSMFRGDIGDIGFSLRQRQSFRRSMEAATINPRDASAHYQLGLVFQHRRQYAEAIARFKQAIQTDNDETDAHFQLGRIAREQGHLQDAIDHFGVVLSQDDKHAHSEVWREIGATYLDARMFSEAKEALEKFVERRAYDPEGLYYYGKTLELLDDKAEAQIVFARCIEAVKTMPHYRHGVRKWHKLARERMTKQQAAT